MTSVHDTAVVDPGAAIGAGTVIGPYAVIEAGVALGTGCRIDAHAVIKSGVRLESGCHVHAGAILGDAPQDLAFDAGRATGVVVGERTVIRETVTVHRSTDEDVPTRIGDDCLLMGGSHVAHDAHLGNDVVLCNGALVAGHVRIEDRAFLSGNTAVHQFCRVGRLVMLSGASAIGKDVGPYLVVSGRSDVSGLNTVGMRRAGISPGARARIKSAYRALFGAPTLDAGLAAVRALDIRHEDVRTICDFYANSRRGFSRPPAGHVMGA